MKINQHVKRLSILSLSLCFVGGLFAAKKELPSNALKFSYSTTPSFHKQHKDTEPPSLLNDGRYHKASRESVQYNDDVTVVIELEKTVKVKKVTVIGWHHKAGFKIDTVSIFVSADKKKWQKIETIKNEKELMKNYETKGIEFSSQVDKKAKYLKVVVTKPKKARRILLGEIIVTK